MPKRIAVGRVTSDKMNKTRVVEIPRKVRHPKYGKFVRQRTICYVHDEQNQSAIGDKVQIIESAPKSKLKRWELLEVLEKSREVDVAAMKAARNYATSGDELNNGPLDGDISETPAG
jgi:small subunit ribosomal protein S17